MGYTWRGGATTRHKGGWGRRLRKGGRVEDHYKRKDQKYIFQKSFIFKMIFIALKKLLLLFLQFAKKLVLMIS